MPKIANQINYGVNPDGSVTKCTAKVPGAGNCPHAAHVETNNLKEAKMFAEGYIAGQNALFSNLQKENSVAEVSNADTAAYDDRENELTKLTRTQKIKLVNSTDNDLDLEILANDNYNSVRNAVAKKTANLRVLRKLSRDKDGGVRVSVIKNEHTPAELLSEMLQSMVDEHLVGIKKGNNRYLKGDQNIGGFDYEAIFANPKLPRLDRSNEIDRLLSYDDAFIPLEKHAKNPLTETKDLVKIALYAQKKVAETTTNPPVYNSPVGPYVLSNRPGIWRGIAKSIEENPAFPMKGMLAIAMEKAEEE